MIKLYAESLGFKYMSASNKEEFLKDYKEFFNDEQSDMPIVFEVFTKTSDENDALYAIRHIVKPSISAKRMAKEIMAKGIIGEKGIKIIKDIKNNIE